MESYNLQDSKLFQQPELNNFFPNSGDSIKDSNHSSNSPYAGVLLNSAIIGKEFQTNVPKSETNSALITSRKNTSDKKKLEQSNAHLLPTKNKDSMPLAINNDPSENDRDSGSQVQPSNDSGPLIKKGPGLGASEVITQAQSTPNEKKVNSLENQVNQTNDSNEGKESDGQESSAPFKRELENKSHTQSSKESQNSSRKLPPIQTNRKSAPVSKNSSSLQIRRQLQQKLKDLHQMQKKAELGEFIENTSEVNSVGKFKSDEIEDDSRNLSCNASRKNEKNDYEDNVHDGAQSQPEEHSRAQSKGMVNPKMIKNYSTIPAKMEPPHSYFKNASYVLPKKNSIMPVKNESSVAESPETKGRVIDLTTPGLRLGEGKEVTLQKDLEGKLKGFEKLEHMNGFIFKQKFQVFKDEDGWEPPYRTYVHNFIPSQENDAGKRMFQCNESSGCCARQCLSGYCRPFAVIVNTCNPNEDPDHHQPFLKIERACNFSCLWFNRPSITVRYIEDGKDEYLGRIKDVFAWGSILLEIYDKNNTLRYVINGSCCQWGLLCNCSCQACHNVKFFVKPVSYGKVLELTKKNTQFSQFGHIGFPNADRYTLSFSSTTSSEDKALLMSAILFLEARHFEGDQ